ncbi:MAG: type I restriction enzyme HsdR N-terminal domain-containing protein [Chlamydiia bacterium]
MLNLPEEQIRLQLMDRLVRELGFPANMLVKERSIHQLPHFHAIDSSLKLPTNRRVDLISYFWDQGQLKPLVLFECKHHKPDSKGFQQLIGYNHWIQAPFLAWVSAEHEGLFKVLSGRLEPLGALKTYKELCRQFEM